MTQTRRWLMGAIALVVAVGGALFYRKLPHEGLSRRQGDPLPADFLEALQHGDARTAEQYLKQGLDPNMMLDDQPLLHQLLTWPNRLQPEIFDLLIQHGADVHSLDADGDTLLHRLADELTIPDDWTAKTGQRLIAAGAEVDARDRAGQTVLARALCNDTPSNSFISHLLAQGADLEALNPQDVCATSLLHLAAQANQPVLIEYALTQGIDVNAVDQSGQTPLHYLRGQAAGEALLEQGANLEALDSAGQTPLASAVCLHGVYALKAEVIDWLLAQGAQSQDLPLEMNCDQRPTTLLMEAIGVDSVALAEVAIANGSNIQTSDTRGQTSLHHAARFNASTVADLLLDQGADINAADNQGYTPLHLAAIHRHLEIAQLLIQQGASVNAVDADGHTALFEAENVLWNENLPDLDPLRTQALVEILRQAGGEI